MDNSRTGFNHTTIRPDDDAFIPIEPVGVPAQFFFAVSPRHPLMLHALNEAIIQLQGTCNVMINNPARKTGPAAFKAGYIHFRNAVGDYTTGYDVAGVYEGNLLQIDGRASLRTAAESVVGSFHTRNIAMEEDSEFLRRKVTNRLERRYVTLAGNRTRGDQYIDGGGLLLDLKHKLAEEHDMPHYSRCVSAFRVPNKTSCLDHIAKEEARVHALNLTMRGQGWYPRYRKAHYVKSADGTHLVDLDDRSPDSADWMFLVDAEGVEPSPTFSGVECAQIRWLDTVENATKCYRRTMADEGCGKKFMTYNTNNKDCACYPTDVEVCKPTVVSEQLTWHLGVVAS